MHLITRIKKAAMDFCRNQLVDISHSSFLISCRGVRKWAAFRFKRKVLFATLVIHCAIAFSFCVCSRSSNLIVLITKASY